MITREPAPDIEYRLSVRLHRTTPATPSAVASHRFELTNYVSSTHVAWLDVTDERFAAELTAHHNARRPLRLRSE